MLMDKFYTQISLPEPIKKRRHFYSFMAEINNQLSILSQTANQHQTPPLNRLAAAIANETRLLCFDELVINNIADAMILGRLLPMLINDGVVIITTSNFPPDKLYDNGLLRERFLPLIELIEQKFDLLDLGVGVDWRRTMSETLTSWFTTPNSRELADQWQKLTIGNPPKPLTLEVAGRTLTLQKTATGALPNSPFRGTAAWFEFSEICLAKLGPRDYLALAQAVRVVFVESIPQFKGDNFDAARRFITLVDSLYEARCGLIASSTVEIDDLYPISAELDSRFPQKAEFLRCLSRLHEMQSDLYQSAQNRYEGTVASPPIVA